MMRLVFLGISKTMGLRLFEFALTTGGKIEKFHFVKLTVTFVV